MMTIANTEELNRFIASLGNTSPDKIVLALIERKQLVSEAMAKLILEKSVRVNQEPWLARQSFR